MATAPTSIGRFGRLDASSAGLVPDARASRRQVPGDHRHCRHNDPVLGDSAGEHIRVRGAAQPDLLDVHRVETVPHAEMAGETL
jgi:hypothetical protein